MSVLTDPTAYLKARNAKAKTLLEGIANAISDYEKALSAGKDLTHTEVKKMLRVKKESLKNDMMTYKIPS